ncbi:MAG: hypothetical protein AMK73_07935, partial [Planctomycetes bacterium SM23_32]
GASQQVSDGVLRLKVAAHAEGGRAGRETMRPIQNRGFRAAVAFRAGPALMARPGAAWAGLRVADVNGRVFSVSFDGGAYAMSVGERSSPGSRTMQLRHAQGDEGESWHTLGLRYDFFGAGQVTVLLDDGELQRYSLDLQDFRLGVFVEADPGVAADAEFREVSCHEK